MRRAFTHGVLALLLLAPAAARAGLFEREDADVAAGNRALAGGNAEEALRRFEAAAKDHGDAPEVAHDRGAALLAAGKPDQALQAFGEAIARRKDGRATAADHAGVGTALAALGRDADARAELQKALELDPDQATARKNLEALLRRQQQERQQQAGNDQEQQDRKPGEEQQQEDELRKPGEDRQNQDSQQQAGNEQQPKDSPEQQAGNEPQQGQQAGNEPQQGQQAGNEQEKDSEQQAENRQQDQAQQQGQQQAAQEQQAQQQQAGQEQQPAANEAQPQAGASADRDGRRSGQAAALRAEPIDRTDAEQLLDALQAGERPYQLYRRQRDRGQRTAHEKDW